LQFLDKYAKLKSGLQVKSAYFIRSNTGNTSKILPVFAEYRKTGFGIAGIGNTCLAGAKFVVPGQKKLTFASVWLEQNMWYHCPSLDKPSIICDNFS
jgi:hypothetical protein